MILIAHRGNYKGRVEKRENHPAHIAEALCAGFDVEIDVWYMNDKFYLGHDKPVYPVDLDFLTDERVWCHAKSLLTAEVLLQIPFIHFFWHENDRMSITSKNYMWTTHIEAQGLNTIYMEIIPVAKLELLNPFFVGGICSDDVLRFCA